MRISSGMMAWNESKTIDLTLKSVVGFADEVVIIDTGSIDGTQEMAREWIERLDLSGEVREMRSKKILELRLASVESCSGDWILMQDAQLVLSDALKRELREFAAEKKECVGALRSLNLMGDYRHYFGYKPKMSAHRVFVEKDAPYELGDFRPNFTGPKFTFSNYAANLSRVRPAWRSWYRGEPFDRRFYRKREKKFSVETNRQYRWMKDGRYFDLIEYVEAEEGLILEDVKKIAPAWYLEQLKTEAKALTKEMRESLPEVLKEEWKNPRYRLMKKSARVVGREPSL